MFDVKGESQVSRDEINFVPSSPVQNRKVKTHAQCFQQKKNPLSCKKKKFKKPVISINGNFILVI